MTAKETKPKKEKKLEIKLINENGKVTGSEPLDLSIAKAETHSHLLHQYELAFQANQRLGTAKAKDRSEVRGGGKKPWRQKGTGRARVGSIRSPLWTKGGVTFGPGNRKYGEKLPKRLKQMALIAGLKRKALDEKLYLIQDFKIDSGKTKACQAAVGRFQLKKPLIVRESHDLSTVRSARNLKRLQVAVSAEVSAHDVLVNDECVLTRAGYQNLIQRLGKSKES